MPGLFDLIQGAMGRPDPNAQLAAQLGQGPGQPGAPNGPQPVAPPGPPGPGGPGAGQQQGQQQQQQQPPQPQAYQSPPDLTNMYMQLAQRQQANEQFNRGLGLMAASMYPGRHPEAIMQAMTGATQDPGALIGNIVKLQQFQQSQQRLAGLQAAIPGLVKAGTLTPEMVPIVQNNPDLLQSIIQQHSPDGVYKNYQIAEQDYINKNSDPNDPQSVAKARSDFEQKVPLVNALTPSGGDAQLNALNFEKNDWISKHPNQPLPDDGRFNSIEDLQSYKNRVNNLSNAQNAASATLPALDGSLSGMQAKANAILSDANKADLDTVLQTNPSKIAQARAGGWGPEIAQTLGMTPSQLELLHQIDELRSTDTSGLKNQNPHLLPSFQSLDADLTGLKNIDVGGEAYRARLTSLTNDIGATRATAIGASGQLDKALNDPTIDQSKIDDSYLPGGRNYLGEPKKLTPDLVAQAKQAIAGGADKNAIIKRYKLMGYLPKGEF